MATNPLRIAILGAGPIGLEAGLYARQLKMPFTIFEQGRIGEHVLRWGYAHVFEHWRLHFTLTDRLDALPELERTGLRATAITHFAAALAVPCRIESLALFTETAPGQPFVLSHRVPLGSTPLPP